MIARPDLRPGARHTRSMATLPPDVLEALRRGEPLEAMKLLRASSSLSLRDAKSAIDLATGRPATPRSSLQDLFGSLAPTSMAPARKPSDPVRPSLQPEILRVPREGDLSPGEMPRRNGAWAVVFLAAGALLVAWFRFRGG